jgi:hypothetical protein
VILKPGAPQHVVLHGPTVVVATVDEAAAGGPVASFGIQVGVREGPGSGVSFEHAPEHAMSGRNGAFVATLADGFPSHVLRVGAPGHRSAESLEIPSDGKVHRLTYTLTKIERVRAWVLPADDQIAREVGLSGPLGPMHGGGRLRGG